jgi:hypothetical protein
MGLSDCEEGKQLLKAAAQSNSEPVAREAFLIHINRCHLCNELQRNDPALGPIPLSAANMPPRTSRRSCPASATKVMRLPTPSPARNL